MNLCSDELLLALADPRDIISVTHLARDPRESAQWQAARRYPANDGNLLSVIALRPALIITMGGGGRDQARIAARIGARLIALPLPATLDDVAAGITAVAAAVGRPERGRAMIARIDRLRAASPAPRDAIFIDGSGRTIAPDGAAAGWLALAGLRQRAVAGDRVDREQLLRDPPAILVESDYRAGEMTRQSALPIPPRARHLRTDGRRWTCLGPSLLPEIERLRRTVAQRVAR